MWKQENTPTFSNLQLYSLHHGCLVCVCARTRCVVGDELRHRRPCGWARPLPPPPPPRRAPSSAMAATMGLAHRALQPPQREGLCRARPLPWGSRAKLLRRHCIGEAWPLLSAKRTKLRRQCCPWARSPAATSMDELGRCCSHRKREREWGWRHGQFGHFWKKMIKK